MAIYLFEIKINGDELRTTVKSPVQLKEMPKGKSGESGESGGSLNDLLLMYKTPG
jgi:hypothetical protein